MNPIRKAGVAAAIVVMLGAGVSACGSDDDGPDSSGDSMSMTDDAMTDSDDMGATGDFTGLNDKSVAGTATISGDTVMLSGFSSDEGPDLHLYLTDGTDENAVGSGVELGTIDFDEATQEFTIPSGTDVSGYSHLVVHCDKAKAVFGAAELTS